MCTETAQQQLDVAQISAHCRTSSISLTPKVCNAARLPAAGRSTGRARHRGSGPRSRCGCRRPGAHPHRFAAGLPWTGCTSLDSLPHTCPQQESLGEKLKHAAQAAAHRAEDAVHRVEHAAEGALHKVSRRSLFCWKRGGGVGGSTGTTSALATAAACRSLRRPPLAHSLFVALTPCLSPLTQVTDELYERRAHAREEAERGMFTADDIREAADQALHSRDRRGKKHEAR